MTRDRKVPRPVILLPARSALNGRLEGLNPAPAYRLTALNSASTLAAERAEERPHLLVHLRRVG
jgi:hypothetical protein